MFYQRLFLAGGLDHFSVHFDIQQGCSKSQSRKIVNHFGRYVSKFKNVFESYVKMITKYVSSYFIFLVIFSVSKNTKQRSCFTNVYFWQVPWTILAFILIINKVVPSHSHER